MRHKVTDVVYRRFNKHWKSKNLWNANLPSSAKQWNLGIKTSSSDTQSLRVQVPESVNYSRKWLCLGNKYFLTSTSTSISTNGPSTSTSTSTQYNNCQQDWGKVFQTMEAVAGNEWRPMVDRRYDGTSRWNVHDDHRRRRPGRSDTGTSWFNTPAPCRVAHDMPWATVWSWPVPEDATSEVSQGYRTHDRVATKSKHQTIHKFVVNVSPEYANIKQLTWQVNPSLVHSLASVLRKIRKLPALIAVAVEDLKLLCHRSLVCRRGYCNN